MLFLVSFSEIVSYALYVLIAVLVLLLMITVHEFGHYVSGKILGFGITEFSIGFGPKLFQRKKEGKETFSVRLLPLGGYCAFVGEDEDSDNPAAFNNKKPWRRIIVLISGALMNYILAVVIIMITFAVYGQTLLCPVKLVGGDYPAEYSLQSKDVLIAADGKNIYLTTDLMSALSGKREGDAVEFTLKRAGETVKQKVLLRADADFKNYEDVSLLYDVLGIYYETDGDGNITESGLYSTLVRFSFLETVGRGFEYSFKIAGTIFGILGQLLTGKLGISSVGGTITTVSMTADAIRVGGIRYLLNISSFIGVNLAVFNLLPIPALDGSRVIFCGIEWIFRKPVKRKVEAVIHTVGFILILLFAVFIDFQHCI